MSADQLNDNRKGGKELTKSQVGWVVNIAPSLVKPNLFGGRFRKKGDKKQEAQATLDIENR